MIVDGKFIGYTMEEILNQKRSFNGIPLRDISKLCNCSQITVEEFCDTAHDWVESMKVLWPEYGKKKEAYIEEFFQMMLAFYEVEQDPSYTQ